MQNNVKYLEFIVTKLEIFLLLFVFSVIFELSEAATGCVL